MFPDQPKPPELERPPTVNMQADIGDGGIIATPYEWRDPSTIPLRPWLFGHWFLRGTVACIVAPGGVGKSTLVVGMALSMVSNRPFLGPDCPDGPCRVWLWNLEDGFDELSRSIQAATKFHDITEKDISGRLFVDSALEGMTLCTATEGSGGFKILQPIYDEVCAELRRRKIDVLFIDPFISSHHVDENANPKIDSIAKAWARVAQDANCCIVLVHHTSKVGSAEVTALSARGAVSLIDAARSTLVLNPMGKRGDAYGISGSDVRRYFTVTDDKPNRAPSQPGTWFKLESVDLNNGPKNEAGDSVGVADRWCPPEIEDEMAPELIARVQALVSQGEWRASNQARTGWVGNAIAMAMGVDGGVKANQAQLNAMAKRMMDQGWLKTEKRRDETRRERPFAIVGNPISFVSAPPLTSGVGQGEEVEHGPSDTHPTTP